MARLLIAACGLCRAALSSDIADVQALLQSDVRSASLIETDGKPVMAWEVPAPAAQAPQQVALARSAGEADVVAYKNGMAIGDTVEVKLTGENNRSQWVKCVLQSKGEEEDTYNVYLPHAPALERKKANVKVTSLRRIESVSNNGVLLFWAVTSSEAVREAVKRNVDHLRQTYPGKADVFLVHIDGGKDEWVDNDGEWYNRNVQFSAESQLPKQLQASSSMLFAQSFYPPQVRLAKAFIPQVTESRNYKWIWMVDEDIDFSVTDLARLFGDAEKTGAMIVGPSVNFEDPLGSKAMQKMYVPGCTPANALCYVHVPRPACQYRYTNFVEALFPIMRQDAFNEMFVDCRDCENQIDRFWCTRPAMKFMQDHEQVCAILDQVAVVHTNGKTLRKWEDVDRSHAGKRDPNDKAIKDYVFDVGSFQRCVQ